MGDFPIHQKPVLPIMTKPHLLLMAHGSRSLAWNASLQDLCTQVASFQSQENFPFQEISCCFLEYGAPSISEALFSLSASASEILALPFFLSVGLHVTTDLPRHFAAVSDLVEETPDTTIFTCRNCRICLVPPLPAAPLLADNAHRRFMKLCPRASRTGLFLVYYGSRRFPDVWDDLRRETENLLAGLLPHVAIQGAYGGDAVDFSPEPLAATLATMAEGVDRLVILPMLVAAGVVQTDVIPRAIELSGATHKIVYARDAVLPDAELARRIFAEACRIKTSFCSI